MRALFFPGNLAFDPLNPDAVIDIYDIWGRRPLVQ